MRVTPEQIERANLVNLPDFLRSQGFSLKQVGREYILQEHDSLHIKITKPAKLESGSAFLKTRAATTSSLCRNLWDLILFLRWSYSATKEQSRFTPTVFQKLNRPKS